MNFIRHAFTLTEVLIAITVGMFLTSCLFVALVGLQKTIRRADQLGANISNMEMAASLCLTNRTTTALVNTSNWSSATPDQNARGGAMGTSFTIVSRQINITSGGQNIFETYLLQDSTFVRTFAATSITSPAPPANTYDVSLASAVEISAGNRVAIFNPADPTNKVRTGVVFRYSSPKNLSVTLDTDVSPIPFTPSPGCCIGTYSAVYFPPLK